MTRDTSGDSLLQRVAHGGERHLPVLCPETRNHYRHMTAYHFAARYVAGVDVLDFGCGTGYGTNFLFRSGGVRSICGTDVSADAISFCRTTYPDLADRFIIGGPERLPLAEKSMDVVLCFQVIEHITDDRSAIREIRRLLRSGGYLLLSTPNRQLHADTPEALTSSHHVREYDSKALRALCQEFFGIVEELGVHGSYRAGGQAFGLERFVGYRAARRIVRYARSPRYVPPVSLADFHVGRERLDEALDLLFVCRRE
jgi:SAM-dependent methyltransferase